MDKTVNIVIPTYNREQLIGSAIEHALGQTYENSYVTVINDGSTDDTDSVLSAFTDRPRFRYITLKKNVGTAQAKNVAIALNDCDYVTFHDSDDRPYPQKIERQVGVAQNKDIKADPILNWSLCHQEAGSQLSVDLVVNEHELVLADGSRHHIRRALSLVDDVFPNLQMAAGVPGDWILINCGLFNAEIFTRLGGFVNGVEEDRDIRNRLLFNGAVVWLIPEILMEKRECADSLTVEYATNYASMQRKNDREEIWKIAQNFQRGIRPGPVPLDLREVQILRMSFPLTAASVPHKPESVEHLERELLACESNVGESRCIA